MFFDVNRLFRGAAAWLFPLFVLALLCLQIMACAPIGTGAVTGHVPPALIVPVLDCPSPPRPGLPALDGGESFDTPRNLAAIMERDDAFRLHVRALEASIRCFRAQAGGAIFPSGGVSLAVRSGAGPKSECAFGTAPSPPAAGTDPDEKLAPPGNPAARGEHS